MAVGVRLFKLLGCEYVIMTNAAGGLNTSYHIGDIMIIADHINVPGMAGLSALVKRADTNNSIYLHANTKFIVSSYQIYLHKYFIL